MHLGELPTLISYPTSDQKLDYLTEDSGIS